MPDHLPRYQQLEWTDENVIRFWRWQSQFPKTYFTYQFGAHIARRLAPVLAGRAEVLDYGCGPGFLIPHLATLGKSVTAADVSAASIDAANREFGGRPGFKGAMTIADLVAANKSYDAIVSVEVIEHLSDEHLESYFLNLKKLLRPGGIACITTPNEEDLDLSMIYCPETDRIYHRWQHVRSWSAESLAAAAAAHGLDVVNTFTTDFSRSPARQIIAFAKEAVKRFLGRSIKRPHLVCVLRKRHDISR